MLVGTPLPAKLSVFFALGPALWIRRVLVRSQEGQFEAALPSRGRSRQSQEHQHRPVQSHHVGVVEPANARADSDWAMGRPPSTFPCTPRQPGYM
jgi:hypothetical protein